MKEKIIRNIVIIINIILFYYLVFLGRNQYVYNMSYLNCILFITSNLLFIYFYGILKNDEKTYNTNIFLYVMFYVYLLIAFTFIIGRPEFRFYDWSYKGQYKPFSTIIYQLKYGSFASILKNIIGNIVMLIPISFLLMIKNDKFKNILYNTLIILPITIIIEIIQTFTHTGTFDVDDIFLNYVGALIFTLIIRKFMDKIKLIFYTNFKLNYKTKIIFFYVSLILLAFFDIILFLK